MLGELQAAEAGVNPLHEQGTSRGGYEQDAHAGASGGAHTASLKEGGWSQHKNDKEWDADKYLGVHRSNDPHMKPIRKLIEKSVESDLAEAIEAKMAMRTKKQTEEDTTCSLGQRKAKQRSLAAAGMTLEVPSGVFSSASTEDDLWAEHKLWRTEQGRMSWSLCTLGKLTKLGAKRKNWKEREFILQDEIRGEPYLAYYEPGHNQLTPRVAKGRVNLTDWARVQTGLLAARLYPVQPATVSNHAAPKTDFEVVTPERTFVLRAQSEEHMLAIVQMLKTVQYRLHDSHLQTRYAAVYPDVAKAKAFIESAPSDFDIIRFKQDGPADDDSDDGEYEAVGGGSWNAGDVVDIESADGWERGATVIGPALSGNVKEMRVKFADGVVDDWDTGDFRKAKRKKNKKKQAGGAATGKVNADTGEMVVEEGVPPQEPEPQPEGEDLSMD